MSNFTYSLFRNFKFGIYFHQKRRMSNFHYDIGIESRPGSQIFLTLAILVACKLRNISHSELAV